MVFSPEWDTIYSEGMQNSIWPWSDLVSYVKRYAHVAGESTRVLELGFGAGANISFFESLGVKYFGTEGSCAAVSRVRKRFKGHAGISIACCDFTKHIPFSGPFDLVVDRSSLTHNSTSSIRSCLSQVSERMREGGKFIGIDWFSTDSAQFRVGRECGDHYTRSKYKSGQFHGVGIVHFSDKKHLKSLFQGSGLKIVRLEHKHSEVVTGRGSGKMAWWNVVAIKS